MTQKIHLLSPQQAQQIAAGEVVERPANIVKELLENSLDAGATTITIAIEKAGKQLISITDDGCGMSREDAELCFSRHATSKLHLVDELMSLSTFGFRGEALASIAAVSEMTLTTKEAATAPQVMAPKNESRIKSGMSETLGTSVIYTHGVHTSTEQVACNSGTTITIKDLFATVPVRKSFLKQDETEWNQIMAAITGLALTHIDRTIKVTKDGTMVLNAPRVKTLKDRITQLWGHNMAQQLSPIASTAKKEPITVTGFASTPPYARYGRQQLIFFVNNRLVKNSDIAKAVLKGYKHALPSGKYPAVCIMIDVDQSQVDVNIHPRKEEVRFTKPGIVARCIQEAITRTLEAAVSNRLAASAAPQMPPLPFEPNDQSRIKSGMTSAKEDTSTIPRQPHKIPSQHLSWDPVKQPFAPQQKADTPAHMPAPELDPSSEAGKTKEETNNFTPRMPADASAAALAKEKDLQRDHGVQATAQKSITAEQASLKICGQLFATYILIEQDNELIMVDQHAAHERILYHQFANNFENKQGTQLLFPQTVTLTEQAITNVLAHEDFFKSQGITLHQSGPTQVAVTSSPPKLQNDLSELIRDAAEFIGEHKVLDSEQFSRQLNEHVHSHMSCKAAVKAGDVLDEQMMHSLVEQLMQTPNKFMCVHGRPTMWAVSKAEIEKRFRRR